MSRNLVPRVPILLALSAFNDEELHTLASGILLAAPTSKLVAADPAMAATVAVLGARDTALAASNKTVADDRAKLHTDLAAEAEDRTALVGALRTYASFASAGARTPADLHGAGLTARDPVTPRLPPAAPDGIDVRHARKGHGKIVVAVHETGTIRREYVAEQSPDGTTWSPLGVGRGKTRTLTGASGTRIWVRFATVRGDQQSEFCTPVLVTIP